ncbi:MAG: hypothetical protein ACRBCS_08415 [Cellvibrionaceae bacterium]
MKIYFVLIFLLVSFPCSADLREQARDNQSNLILRCLAKVADLDVPIKRQKEPFGRKPNVDLSLYENLNFKTLLISDSERLLPNLVSCNIFKDTGEVFYITVNFRNNQSLVWISQSFKEMDQSLFWDAQKLGKNYQLIYIDFLDIKIFTCLKSSSIEECNIRGEDEIKGSEGSK